MVTSENLDMSSEQTTGKEEELLELGCASDETRGLFFGSTLEVSILPLRLF